MFSAFSNFDWVIILLRIPAILLAISVHESAHAIVSDKLGDPSAKYMGRISLNPFRHFDILGTVMMLFLGFGFAKPVQINMRNLKHPNRDSAIIALAGPLSNLLAAIAATLLFSALSYIKGLPDVVFLFAQIFIMLNTGLFVFNMLPIPPLDGSRIICAFLPNKIYYKLLQYERYIMIAMFVLIFAGFFDTPLSYLNGVVYNFVISTFAF